MRTDAAELRAEIRAWRRGRSELRIWRLFEDAYVALISVAIIGSMVGNVLWGLRAATDSACTAACADARSLVPLVAALTAVLIAMVLARLLGPVFVSPATSAWLLTTPVDRRDLLRPPLWRMVAIGGLTAVLIATVPVVLAGRGATESASYLVSAAGGGAAATAYAAWSQIGERRGAARLTWLLAAVLWLLLLASATGLVALPAADGVADDPVGWWTAALVVVAIGLTVAAAALGTRADHALPAVRRRTLAETEAVWPSLSGALASFDLGLMYDVLLARRWSAAATVRSRRGGPSGWWAMVDRDLRRAVRSPQPWAVLVLLLAVPYALAAAEAGRGVMLGTSLAALLVGPSLCSGLRVITRTDSLAAMLPFDRRAVVVAHLVVPGVGLMAFAAAAAPALLAATGPPAALGLSLATGLVGVAATVRWVCARPPDFAAPLVSTPAGGVPPGLLANLARGVDVWLLAGLPLLIAGWGVWLSLTVSLLTLGWLTRPTATSQPR
ncbi:DUF6297 family protein [Nocardioides sambongensis]|uniref:DUF6297 family protein n=1 Tax=Nocardioides sambongensis TaxID=2589074 RepID=UPI00112C09C6|nr:DUF6297 family protein [Nocardioides sambongensis]